MKTRVRPCCGKQTFANQAEAQHRLDRMTQLGVSRVLPMGVEKCRNGWHLAFPVERPGLAPVSKKRQQENVERRRMVDELWPDEKPRCVRPGCRRLADDVHEPLTRGRGGSITDPDNAQPLCRFDHDELTFGEPAWAYELGLLIHSWEKTGLAVLASVRKQLLAGDIPVEDIAYCHHCRAWLPTDHDCDQSEEEEDAA